MYGHGPDQTRFTRIFLHFQEDETIFFIFEYFAHESLNLSLEQIKDGNHGYATMAARFAHKIFDHLCDNRGAFMDLLASQVILINFKYNHTSYR